MMASETVFLDANVFMYAAGSPHAYKIPCVRILFDVETGILPAVVNTEIFQELLYRYSHIGLGDRGVELCRRILEYPLRVMSVTESDLRLALDLLTSYSVAGLRPRDAIHGATMQNNRIARIISADKDFDRLSFVERLDPLTYPLGRG